MELEDAFTYKKDAEQRAKVLNRKQLKGTNREARVVYNKTGKPYVWCVYIYNTKKNK